MKISTWAEVMGIAALIVSLVFVGIEIRHNTAATEAQALLELNVAGNEVMMAQAEEGELAEIMSKGLRDSDSLTDIERLRFQSWVYSMLNVHENAFMFFSRGILDEATYEAHGAGTCILLNDPGVKAMWQNDYLSFHQEFEDYIIRRCKIPRSG